MVFLINYLVLPRSKFSSAEKRIVVLVCFKYNRSLWLDLSEYKLTQFVNSGSFSAVFLSRTEPRFPSAVSDEPFLCFCKNILRACKCFPPKNLSETCMPTIKCHSTPLYQCSAHDSEYSITLRIYEKTVEKQMHLYEYEIYDTGSHVPKTEPIPYKSSTGFCTVL